MAGLFAQSSLGGVGVRPGVLAGDRGLIVEGGSGWSYIVWQHHVVSERQPGDGAHLFGNDGSVTVGTGGVGTTVAPAPGTGSRVDIIWTRQRSNSENGDGTSEAELGVTSGTSGSPGLPPSIPLGAVELGRAVVSAGNANTAAASITQTYLRAAVRGTPIPVRSDAERDALASLASAQLPVEVVRADKGGRIEKNAGSGWFCPELAPVQRLAGATGFSSALVATGGAGDVLGPSVVNLDRRARVSFDVKMTMQAGANSAGFVRLIVDGSQVAERRWANGGSTAPVPADVSAVVDLAEGARSWVVQATVDGGGVGATPGGGQYEIAW